MEISPKSLWVEELPPGGFGTGAWDDLEDGITTSRRAVLMPSRLPVSPRARARTVAPRREDESQLHMRVALSA